MKRARTLAILALAGLLTATSAAAAHKRRRPSPPPPPPRVWHYFDDAPSPYLQYSYLSIPDARRTTLSCEESGVVQVEQALPGRRAPQASTLIIGAGGESQAASAHEGPDDRDGAVATVVAGSFTVESPVIQALAGSGELKLATHAQTFDLPRIPDDILRRFFAHCRP